MQKKKLEAEVRALEAQVLSVAEKAEDHKQQVVIQKVVEKDPETTAKNVELQAKQVELQGLSHMCAVPLCHGVLPDVDLSTLNSHNRGLRETGESSCCAICGQRSDKRG